MVLPQAMAWVQYWFRVLSLKFCGKSKKICGDISQLSPAFCMYESSLWKHSPREYSPKGKVHRKKSKKKLTSVSFAFTHTYTLEKLTLLLFSPKRTWKIFSWYLTRKLVSFYVRRQHQSIAVWWKGSKKSLKGQCAESFRQAHFCKSTGKRRALFWAKIRTKF